MKQRLDRAFEKAFGKHPKDGYHTAIEKGRGQRSGLPDRFYTALFGHCWLEAKVHPNKLDDLQRSTIKRLAKAGSRVVVITLEPSSDQLLLEEVLADGTFAKAPRFCWKETRKMNPFWTAILQQTSGSFWGEKT